jgi:cell division FtsZ-interacting protein ZapD
MLSFNQPALAQYQHLDIERIASLVEQMLEALVAVPAAAKVELQLKDQLCWCGRL